MSSPGSYVIRPTRQDAEDDAGAFYAILDFYRRIQRLPLKIIAETLGDTTANPEANLSKRIDRRSFAPQDRADILKYIFEDSGIVSGRTRSDMREVKDALYFAVLNFFNAKETSQDKARARALGTYRFWRFSVEHDDEFVFGKIAFSEDPKTGAVIAEMRQVLRSGNRESACTEHFSGYLFRLSHMYCMLLSDRCHHDIRISLFPTHKLSHVGTGVNPRSIFPGKLLHVSFMDGYCLGVDGGKGFFSPVHLALEDDADRLTTLDSELDIVSASDPRIPERVVRKLRRAGPLKRL